MKKITVILLISLSILGCKTKKVIKNESQKTYKSEEIKKSDTTEKKSIKEIAVKESTTVKNEEIKDNKSEIQISGKVDKNNPVTYYNVVNGDTIDLFKITGNADFIFKSSNNTQKSAINNKSIDNTSNIKNEERSISNAVENVKNTVEQVKSKTVEVVKKDFTIGSYVVFFLWGLVAIALLILILWLRKSNAFKYITKFFKN